MSSSTALKRLMVEYRELTESAPDGIIAGPITETNFFEWECLLEGPEGTPFEDAILPATLSFPKDYPLNPPKMKFTINLFHPNIYKDGTVCASILHSPGDDPMHYEQASERWSPVQSIEKILLSIVSMLAEPNTESPANVDAAKLYRTNQKEYEAICRRIVRAALGLA